MDINEVIKHIADKLGALALPLDMHTLIRSGLEAAVKEIVSKIEEKKPVVEAVVEEVK